MTATSALPEKLLTPEEAGDILNCCAKTVTNLIQAGSLAALRVGKAIRIKPSELARFQDAGGSRRTKATEAKPTEAKPTEAKPTEAKRTRAAAGR